MSYEQASIVLLPPTSLAEACVELIERSATLLDSNKDHGVMQGLDMVGRTGIAECSPSVEHDITINRCSSVESTMCTGISQSGSMKLQTLSSHVGYEADIRKRIKTTV